MSGFINQFLRSIVNRLAKRGIKKGIDAVAKQSAGGKAAPAKRQQAKVARDAVKRARQAARITRRAGR